MWCVNNLLLGWAKGCKCPNVDLQNNLKAWTICRHSLYKEKGETSFSTSKMMFGNFSFVCSHGHWGPASNGCHFNNEYNGNQLHFVFSSKALMDWSNWCNYCCTKSFFSSWRFLQPRPSFHHSPSISSIVGTTSKVSFLWNVAFCSPD